MRSVLVYAVGGLSGQLIGLLVSPVVTRLLTPEQFGILALISTIFTTMGLFWVVGMDWAFPYFRVRFSNIERLTILRNTATIVATAGILITSIGFLSLSLGSNWISAFFRIEGILPMILIALWLFVSGINNWYLYILRYENLPASFVKVSLMRAILLPALFIPAAWFAASEYRLIIYFFSAIIALTMSLMVGLTAIHKYSGERLYNRNFFSTSLAKEMLNYGIVLMPAGVLYTLMTVSDRYLISWLSTTAELGIYSLAANIALSMIMFKGWFNLAWEPYIINYIQNNPREIYEAKINETLYYAAIIFNGTALILGLWAGEIVAFIYPTYFERAALVVPLLLISGAVSGLSLIAVVPVIVTQRRRYHPVIYSVALIINVIACIALIPKFGGVGAAISMLIAESFILISWIFVSNLLVKTIRLHVVRFALLTLLTILIISLHLSFEITWQIRLGISLIMASYMILRFETIEIIKLSKEFAKQGK